LTISIINTNTSVNITANLLDKSEKDGGLAELSSKERFLDILKLDKAILYLLVDWSGPERESRYIVYRALNELNKKEIPVYKIDCSDQTKEYVVDWLIGQKGNKKHFYYGGWGETLFIEKGKVIDFIENPAQLGLDKTKEKLKQWVNTAANMG
jgi:hypothetical protein